jgi:hypothetical protein
MAKTLQQLQQASPNQSGTWLEFNSKFLSTHHGDKILQLLGRMLANQSSIWFDFDSKFFGTHHGK